SERSEQVAHRAASVVAAVQGGRLAHAGRVGALDRRAVRMEETGLAPPPAGARTVPTVGDGDRVALTVAAMAPGAAGEQAPPPMLERVDLQPPVVDVETPRAARVDRASCGVVAGRVPMPHGDQGRKVQAAPGKHPEGAVDLPAG